MGGVTWPDKHTVPSFRCRSTRGHLRTPVSCATARHDPEPLASGRKPYCGMVEQRPLPPCVLRAADRQRDTEARPGTRSRRAAGGWTGCHTVMPDAPPPLRGSCAAPGSIAEPRPHRRRECGGVVATRRRRGPDGREPVVTSPDRRAAGSCRYGRDRARQSRRGAHGAQTEMPATGSSWPRRKSSTPRGPWWATFSVSRSVALHPAGWLARSPPLRRSTPRAARSASAYYTERCNPTARPALRADFEALYEDLADSPNSETPASIGHLPPVPHNRSNHRSRGHTCTVECWGCPAVRPRPGSGEARLAWSCSPSATSRCRPLGPARFPIHGSPAARRAEHESPGGWEGAGDSA